MKTPATWGGELGRSWRTFEQLRVQHFVWGISYCFVGSEQKGPAEQVAPRVSFLKICRF